MPKRSKYIFTFFVSLYFGITLYAATINSPVIIIESAHTEESTAIISIKADKFLNIRCLDLKILYDSSIAKVKTITKNASLKGNLQFNISDPGAITLGWFAFPEVTVADGSVLFNIYFEKIAPGTTALIFETTDDYNCQLYNSDYTKLIDQPSDNYFKPGALTFNPENSYPSLKVESTIHPQLCNGTGKILLYATDLPDGKYTLYYDEGQFNNVEFISSIATVEAHAGRYNNIRFTLADSSVPSGINVELKNPSAPEAPVIGEVIQPSCDNSWGKIILTGLPKGSWTLLPGNINGTESKTQINKLSAGSYQFRVINEAGCISEPSIEVTIEEPYEIPPIPNINSNGPTTLCKGEEIILTTGEASSYCWSTGDTTQYIVTSVPGSYMVTITNEHGCSSTSDPVIVSVIDPSEINLNLEADATTVNEGQKINFIANISSGIKGIYLWHVNNELIYSDTIPAFTHIPEDGDEIYVIFNSNELCKTYNEIYSDKIMIKVDPVTSGKYINQLSSLLELSCYPNPFDKNPAISYSIPADGKIYIELAGMDGSRYCLQSKMTLNAGIHTMEITDSFIPQGFYILTLFYETYNHPSVQKSIKILKR